MAKRSPVVQAHLEWLGLVQPTGLLVSPMALERAGVVLPRNDRESQARLVSVTEGAESDRPRVPDFEVFARTVLGWTWQAKYFAGTADAPIPDTLRHHLEDYGETLAPDFAVADRDAAEGGSPWQLLVRVLPPGRDLDDPVREGGKLEASPHSRLERLLRAVEVPACILFNGDVLRLVSAPRGESSGWIDFRVADMVLAAGRPVCAAMAMLLSQSRLLTGAASKRLPALLVESRKYQNEVSEQLAEQVLHALYELLRGLESADARSGGEILREVRHERPDEVYHGLLNVLLRLVFLLYAEERGMLPADPVFGRHYSLAGLHRRLSADAALYPDTMDARFGAWAQLIVLFRMIHDGAKTGTFALPARHGVLFDPDRYPWLEGRTSLGNRQVGERLDYPRIPDGAIQRVLEKLLVLEGERLSYRALDVEQIGSIYETMMGFRIETATGASAAIKAQKKGGAPTTIDLDALLQVPATKREKWTVDKADRKLPRTVTDPLKAATTLEELHAALERVLDKAATPDLVPKGSLVLQPSEARRKSGSHYTPRELTEPIVRTTLRPILDRLREETAGPPAPDQILDLKVCDPAMGSGAFLVEACRQLGDALIEAWAAHDTRPPIPGDEDEIIHARRLVAQRCLYGVDRNPMAVDLAKVSLWLATLAREHAFTFVDHALRHGDSLIGLTNAEIAARDWSNEEPLDSPRYRELKASIEAVVRLRRQIREAGDESRDWELRDLLDEAEHQARDVRTWADLVLEAFFLADKDAARKKALGDVTKRIAAGVDSRERGRLDEMRREDPPLAPFHWELEFPEAFDRPDFGFDAIVGNPPFLGGPQLSTSFGGPELQHWLKGRHPGSKGHADLCVYFFRAAFLLLRRSGVMGLVATNSICEGANRKSGLAQLLSLGGRIIWAMRATRWPGSASVVVSQVVIERSASSRPACLDGQVVSNINSHLRPRQEVLDPVSLGDSSIVGFMGSGLGSSGFIMSPEEFEELAPSDRELEVIWPYAGAEDLNDSPCVQTARWAINFGRRTLEEASSYKRLISIVEERVRPARMRGKDHGPGRHGKKYWWQFTLRADPLYEAIRHLDRCLVAGITTTHLTFSLQPIRQVFPHTVVVVASNSWASFAMLQSSVHGLWARELSSAMGTNLRYTVRECLDNFPFVAEDGASAELCRVGREYYELRAALMVETDLGLTKTYNCFHDPDENDPKIVRLRELHAAMDHAVLNAYGWTDIPTDCEFLLDYEDEDDDGSSRRKKPWRYRWPDAVRDEVLARLLELNAKRAEEERRAGHKAGARRGSDDGDGGLFD